MNDRRLNPEPIVVEPSSGEHKRSLIILHGRGSNGDLFGTALLQTLLPNRSSLKEALPDTRFIFPSAARQRAQVYKRSIITQWFDNWSLDRPTYKEELQFDGLKQSSGYIESLLETEISLVGADNVILWGLSQGCATSLISLLLWNGPKLAAVIGMCGWLPLRKRIAEASGDGPTDADDPFATEESASVHSSRLHRAQQYLREELDLTDRPPTGHLNEIPIFLGHGSDDEKVPTYLGREAGALLKTLSFDVSYHEYTGLAHWYSPKMLQDILAFIKSGTGWEVLHLKDA